MTDPSNCSNCGAEFHCGVEEPKCWCVEYPFVTPTASLSGCMCPKCLEAYADDTSNDSVNGTELAEEPSRRS